MAILQTPVAVPVGGQWERLRSAHSLNVPAGGFTQEWSADGSKFAALRFDLSFEGQSINININGTARMWGAINLNKHDGTGTYLHPNPVTNSRYALRSRGTGFLRGVAMAKRSGGAGWLVHFHGYTALDGSGGWVPAGGDYWRIDGRMIVMNQVSNDTGWNFLWGFSSDEAGAYNLSLEGMRG